jgi:hypothetical protein
MMIRFRLSGAIGAAALALAALPLTALVAPAVSQADPNCDVNYFWNSATNQCQFCDTPANWWNYDTNTCLDVTPAVGPIVGPAGPVGVGPDPVVGPVGPVGVGPNPVVGPVGPGGIGPR